MASFRLAKAAARPTLAVGGLLMGMTISFGDITDGSAVSKDNFLSNRKIAAASVTSLIGYHRHGTLCEEPLKDDPSRAKNMPVFTEEQVARRNGKDLKEVWVTYSDHVYDITTFVQDHKGGAFIMNAAGGPIEEYWAYWAYHTHLDEPMNILKKYHIGYLEEKPDDDESVEEKVAAHYMNDPPRDARHIAWIKEPFCSETPPELQTSLYTPNEVFYVRNHAPVPELTAENHTIQLQCCPMGNVRGESQSDTCLEDLGQKYPLKSIASVMECAGNRVLDLEKIHPTAFEHTPFRRLDRGMMGNAVWSGYSLRSIILDNFPWLAELSKDDLRKYHVEFEGVDSYVTSTPLERVMDPTADALLAVSMNGESLPPDHGFPVRALLPGIAGARNCKWLHTIRIIPHESEACFTKVYYRNPHGEAIQEMPMQSFLTSKEQRKDGNWRVKGVAWGGGSGVGVSSIQVRTDDGAWKEVPLQNWTTGPRASRDWGWIVFEYVLPSKSGVFTCRIVDKNGVTQPEALWYPKGYLSNTWHSL